MKKNVCLFFLAIWCSATALTAQSLASFERYPLPDVDTRAAASFLSPASEYDDYGGKLGFGISLFNGFGLPVRYYFTPHNVLEGGLYLGGVAVWEQNTNGGTLELQTYETNLMLGAGYSYFGNRFLKEKKRKSKIRAHGLAIRGQHLIGNFKTTFASLGWAMETFKKDRKKTSFIFELGIQGTFPNFVYNGVEYSDARPGMYLRCHWNFFLK